MATPGVGLLGAGAVHHVQRVSGEATGFRASILYLQGRHQDAGTAWLSALRRGGSKQGGLDTHHPAVARIARVGGGAGWLGDARLGECLLSWQRQERRLERHRDGQTSGSNGGSDAQHVAAFSLALRAAEGRRGTGAVTSQLVMMAPAKDQAGALLSFGCDDNRAPGAAGRVCYDRPARPGPRPALGVTRARPTVPHPPGRPEDDVR